MDNLEVDILKRALDREKKARKAAEKILEEKSRELYFLSTKLQETNTQLESLLKQKSSELKGVFENINDAYIVITLDGFVLKMNDIAKQIFEYDIDNEIFNVNDVLLPDQIQYAHNSFNQLVEKGSFNNFITKIQTKTGALKWIQINATSILNDENQPIAAQGIIRDITQEIKASEQLKESEKRLAALILSLDSGILLEDQNGNIVLTNKRFCEIFKIDLTPDKLIGLPCADQLVNVGSLFQNPELEFSKIVKILENKSQQIGDEVFMTDGSIFERDFFPIYIDNEHKGNLWKYRDVTLRRTYRKSLEQEKEKYSSIIANMNLGLVEVDTADTILMVNQSFCEMSGFSKEELIGKKGADVLLVDEAKQIITNQNNKRLKGESNSYEIIVKNKSGETKTWLISGAPNYNFKGDVIGSIGIHLDITEIKKLQQQMEVVLRQLEQSNKDLQDYAHVVSHDLKSPLRSVYALVDWIKNDNKAIFDAITLENFKLIEETLESMEHLISNILEYSSLGFEHKLNTNVDLNELLLNLSKTLYIPEHIKLTIKTKLPILKGNKAKLQQLFQNLISNSVKFANKKNGLITIDVIDFKDYYQFSFADNGIGIDPKNHKKIFEIFQSLKKSKDSTGIGLSIVKKIVELHGGKIWVESEIDNGCTFFFTLKK